jgi:hypothetical protein
MHGASTRGYVRTTFTSSAPRLRAARNRLVERPLRTQAGTARRSGSSPDTPSLRRAFAPVCGLGLPRAAPRFHRDRRHPSSPGRGGDRTCDNDDKEPYPCHDRGTEACSAGRLREGGRDGDRPQRVAKSVDSRACPFPRLRVGLDDTQEDHPDPRESLQNMDSLLQAGRIPCFRLLSRRQHGPLARQRERHDPGDLAVERPPRALRIHLKAATS